MDNAFLSLFGISRFLECAKISGKANKKIPKKPRTNVQTNEWISMNS